MAPSTQARGQPARLVEDLRMASKPIVIPHIALMQAHSGFFSTAGVTLLCWGCSYPPWSSCVYSNGGIVLYTST